MLTISATTESAADPAPLTAVIVVDGSGCGKRGRAGHPTP